MNGAAESIVLTAEGYDAADPMTLGVGRNITTRHMVELIATVARFQGEVRRDASKPDRHLRRALDTSRGRTGFDFGAKASTEDGLLLTLPWLSHVRRVTS